MEVVALRFWSISHGAVIFEIIVGMGDDRARANESLAMALNSLG